MSNMKLTNWISKQQKQKQKQKQKQQKKIKSFNRCGICLTPRVRPCKYCPGDADIWAKEKKLIPKKPKNGQTKLNFVTKSGKKYQKIIKKHIGRKKAYPYRSE